MISETLDDHAYIPAALAAAEPTWVTNLLDKLQHHDTNVNALRFEVATLRAGVQALRGDFAALHTEFSESKNTNAGAESLTITEGLPTNTDTETAAATLSDLTLEVARLHRRADELPVLLKNSRAHSMDQIYNPTTYMPSPETLLPSDGDDGLPEALVPPNPISRDELLLFTVDQCIASAANLNLPPLPSDTDVVIRRRQIAVRLGVELYFQYHDIDK